MSELKTVLGFEASDAIATLRAMETALKGWDAAMRGASGATRTFNTEGVKVSRTLLRLTAAARKHRDATTQVGLIQGKTTQQVQKYANTIDAAAKVHDALIQNIKRTTAATKVAAESIKTAAKVQDSLVRNIKRTSTATEASTGSIKTAAKVQDSLVWNIKRTTAATRAAAESTARATVETEKQSKKIIKGSKSVTNAVVTGGKKQEEAAKRVLLSWQSVIRIFAIQVIHQAVTKITNSMWEGVTASRAYEISLAEIQTIGVEFRKDFEGLSDQVRAFSDELGAPIESVAEGVYQTLSNQVTDAGHAFEFMASAQAFAIASVTETQSAVALLSSVMNSYNISINQSAKVGGKLAKIIELGRLRGEEFANTFGRVTVLASQLNISLDEVGATLATLTVSGLKYNEASTLMINIMLKLIRPTEELKKRYNELGVAGAEAGIQAFGFQGFLDKISEKSGTSVTALGKLFNRVRAIRGVMGLANDNAAKYIKNLEGIRAAGAAELFEKRDIIFKTNAKQVEIELNKLRNTMVVGFGRTMNDALKFLFDTFGSGTEIIQGLGVAATGAAAALIVLKGSAVGATVSVAALSAAFVPIVFVASVAIASAALFTFANKAKKEAIEVRKVFEEQSKLALKTHLDNLQLEIDAQKKRDKEVFGNIQEHIFERQKAFNAASKELVKLEDLIFSGIVDQLGDKISQTNSFFSNLEKKAAAADTVIRSLNETIQQVQFDISDFNFERELRGLDPIQKAFVSIKRSTQLRKIALEAARKGEIELADIYNKRAKTAAGIALQSADESENKRAIIKAEEAVRAIYLSEIAILKRKKTLTEREKTQIESVAKQIFLQRQELKFLNTEIKTAAEEFEKVRFDPVKREEILNKIKGLADEMEMVFSDIKIKFKLPEAVDMRSMITGESEAMSRIISESLEAINRRAAELTVPKTAIDIKLRERFPGAGTPEEMSAALLEYTKAKEKAIEADKIHAIAIREISTGLNENREILKSLDVAYEDTLKVNFWDKIFFEMDKVLGVGAAVSTDVEKVGKASKKAIDLTTEAVRLLNAEELDIKAFKIVKESLADLGEGATSVEIVQGLGALIDNLNLIEEAKKRMTGVDVIFAQEELIQAQNDFEEINRLIGEEAAAAATVGATSIAENMTRTQQAIDTTIRRVKALNTELRMTITPMPIANKRFGGMLYRADGGWTPRGTDTVPAMLTPGEMVMNVNASRKFFSTLTAMNAGVTPQYRQNGGMVTNVGDVNITVNESSSAQQTARETMQAFRREMRRGTGKI